MPEDWLALSRAARDDVRRVLDELPGRAAREPVVGRGEGGDDTTAIDAAAEEVILDRFRGEDVKLVSEEVGVLGNGRFTVVVDPIDGSLNAKRGIPFFSISIAVAEGEAMDDVFFGYVYDFGTGEEWTATRGGGAFLERVSAHRAAEERARDPLVRSDDDGLRLGERGAVRRRGAPAAHHGLARDHVVPPRRWAVSTAWSR